MFASGQGRHAECESNRLLLFPKQEDGGTATGRLNRAAFQAKQHMAASAGSAVQDFSQGIKGRGGEEEGGRAMC